MKTPGRIAALVVSALFIAGCGTYLAAGTRAACDAPDCNRLSYWFGPAAAVLVVVPGLAFISHRRGRD